MYSEKIKAKVDFSHLWRNILAAVLVLVLSGLFGCPANGAERTPLKDYPEPGYNFDVETLTLKLPVKREYKIAWISDVHLICDKKAGEGVKAGYLPKIDKRRKEFAVDRNGIYSYKLWPEMIAWVNNLFPDAVIFGGDVMDYCSAANIRKLKSGFKELDPSIKRMYLRADHDYGRWYGGKLFSESKVKNLHKQIDGDSLKDKCLELGDVMLLGVNDSTSGNMPDKQYKWLVAKMKTASARKKPVILVTHVPYTSVVDTSLKKLSMRERNEAYYWDTSDPDSRFIPRGTNRKFFRMLYERDTVFRQVLSGHLHAGWDGMMSEVLPEHIFDAGFKGSVGIIHIVPDDKK